MVDGSTLRAPNPFRQCVTWGLEQVMHWRLLSTSWLMQEQLADSQGCIRSWLHRAAGRLMTHNDRFRLHMALGLLCACNILVKAVRLCAAGTIDHAADRMLLGHAALALSALQFPVPSRGDAIAHGYISREIRWHAIFFSLRAIFVALAHRLSHGASLDAPLIMLICLPFHLGADWATRRWGTEGWSSIRGHVLQPLMPADVALRRCLSCCQFINNHGACRRNRRAGALASPLPARVRDPITLPRSFRIITDHGSPTLFPRTSCRRCLLPTRLGAAQRVLNDTSQEAAAS